MKVNVLCLGLREYKSRSLLLPLLRFKQRLSRSKINVEIFTTDSDELSNCDTVIIEDRYYINGKKKHPELTTEQMNRLKELGEKVDKLLWFDTSDSPKIKLPSIIPYVNKYCKKQLFADKNLYREPLYESRLYSNYYKKNFDNLNMGEDRTQSGHVQLDSETDLSKLAVFWNIGHNIHSPAPDIAWKILDKLPYMICENLPWEKLLKWTQLWTPIDAERPIDISGRFSTTYALDGVEFHRKRMEKQLQNRFDSEAVGSLAYWRELRKAKVLLSPFGYGEVCLRDFEGFMSGCVVVKPDMDHLKTWPPVYENNETIVSVSWDMSDLEEQVDQILENYSEYKAIAEKGQNRYRKYLTSDSAPDLFVDHFNSLLNHT